MVVLWHSLTIFVLLCTAFVDGTSSKDNLAKGKETYQSSTPYSQGNSNNAVDGDRNSDYFHGSCTHTEAESEQYWYVDLGAQYRVDFVVIYNRRDCCPERLTNTEVYVVPNKPTSWSVERRYLCGSIPSSTINAEEIEIECRGRQGRFVFIRKTDRNALTLCEVEVFRQKNLARGKETDQTRTVDGGVASRAVDGDRNSDFNDGSCTLTDEYRRAYWEVNLGATYSISEVVIYYPTDCCSKWLDNAKVYIISTTDSEICGFITPSSLKVSPIVLQCNNIHGSTVWISKQIEDHNVTLSVCEVEVYGTQSLSRGKKTSAGLAVDGDITTCAVINSDKSWYVDLGAEYIISEIVVYFTYALTSAKIYFIPDGVPTSNEIPNEFLCKNIRSNDKRKNIEYICGGIQGRIVFIKSTNNKPLTLCEVEVYN